MKTCKIFCKKLPDLQNIGSCSWHVVHESCKKDEKESGWNLGNTLHSLRQIFHDTQARKENFIQITGSDLFSFWFCQHKWVKVIKVAEQALKI